MPSDWLLVLAVARDDEKRGRVFFVSFFFFFFSFVEGGNNPVPRIIPRFDEKQVWCQAPLGYSQVRALGLPLGFSHVGADPREMPPGFSGPVDFSARILIFLRHLRPCSILSPPSPHRHLPQPPIPIILRVCQRQFVSAKAKLPRN
jgi:hypothetical protein